MSPADSVIADVESLPDGLVVSPQGEIDFSRSPQLRSELLQLVEQRRPGRLLIDLSKVHHMDSSGVATLVEVMQQQRQAERRLVLCALQPRVMSIFQVLRLDAIFTIVDSRDEALKA